MHITSKLYEGPTLAKWQEWYGTKPTIALGPVSPPSNAVDLERETTMSTVGKDVKTFLDNALDKLGPHSVIYVCRLISASLLPT